MYGLILENIIQSIRLQYGAYVLENILRVAGLSQCEFVNNKMYSDCVVARITKAAHHVTGTPVNQLTEQFGVSFVTFLDQYGYDRILKVLGRNMSDFLNGLDNLHEYLRFTYPKLKPPSFFCEAESKVGLTLHYRSRRKGYLYYVMGQIKSVGSLFYNTAVDIEVVQEETSSDLTHVIMKLHFDNTAFQQTVADRESKRLSNTQLSSDFFFDAFPFHIVFDRSLVIQNVGSGTAAVMGDVVGRPLPDLFSLCRPLVGLTLDNILMNTNNVFELRTINPVKRVIEEDPTDPGDDTCMRLSLKGQMLYLQEWKAVMFLATPIMENLDCLSKTGLYINDLSMHDSSRDLVLAATQQSSELKLALDQEKQKGSKLEESMRKLDDEMKRTDSLLYQMIPKTVADRLRNGEPAVDTCQVFECVTILFSDVVGFTRICSQITPMAVVSMLNAMYTMFDKLSEKHSVYKVETIGDAYMVVSGAPTVTKYHAQRVSEMAFDMLGAMEELIEPSSGNHMRIRVGLHSGTVVAGVVGLKMPRYCLFGETVNTASKMENNGEAMKINISEVTKSHLDGEDYDIEEHGEVDIKGKTSIKTYWLMGKSNSSETNRCLSNGTW